MTVDYDSLDKIHIRDLQLRCIIGVNEEERREKQDVVINITMYADLKAAGKSDRIEDTVDYKETKKRILALVEQSSSLLVEHLAEQVARICLADDRVKRAVVSVGVPFLSHPKAPLSKDASLLFP